MYNEMVVLKVVQGMTRMALHPPEAFKEEVREHMKESAQRYTYHFNFTIFDLTSNTCEAHIINSYLVVIRKDPKIKILTIQAILKIWIFL